MQSNLSDVSPTEEMTLHLGADQSIRISPHPVLTVRGNTRSIGKSNQTVPSTHIVAIKNTKESVVSIDVSDQLPLSSDDKIKVGVADDHVTTYMYWIMETISLSLLWLLSIQL